MVDKVVVFNIALDALLIDYQTTDPDNDQDKRVKKLNLMFPLALAKTLADLDLNKTATKVKLELTTSKSPHFRYVYKYPSVCAKLRRIVSPFPVDNFETRIPFATESIDNRDMIVTDEPEAVAEIQPTTVNLSSLNPNAAVALGYNLAMMCNAQITGKGSRELREAIKVNYIQAKAEACEDDQNENVDSTPDEFKSEFVQARLGGNRRWPLKI